MGSQGRRGWQAPDIAVHLPDSAVSGCAVSVTKFFKSLKFFLSGKEGGKRQPNGVGAGEEQMLPPHAPSGAAPEEAVQSHHVCHAYPGSKEPLAHSDQPLSSQEEK